jgi:ABC-2 type transport system ATP-binding protein
VTTSEVRASNVAVATQKLSKHYGADCALENVELCVPDGSVYVLVGVNGAGKSTLFKILMNLERADSGSAEVFGLDSARSGPEVRAQVGYVPERHDAPYGAMTCGGLLRHVSTFYPAWDHRYASHLIGALGVRSDRRVGGLSKGETRRVQLVMALAHRPSLLLLDEPTDGLDPMVRRRVLVLLAEHLADSPTTVLISTHHLHELENLADHVGVLRDGHLVAQMSRDELQQSVKSYQLEVPDGWQSPAALVATSVRRSSSGRDVQCILVGKEHEVVQQLAATGARIRNVNTLALEDAALAFLSEDPS